jgi:UDP-N-acetylmuramyl pentapeptide phosphotransferase/UDP-N-acetylglucosamine-1-phosphate transferase
LALIVALLVTATITPAVARLAVQLGIVDRPGPLKLQRKPVPYLGGVAVALGMVAPLVIAWPAALVPLGLALALGLADDRAALPLTIRLPAEFGIGVAALFVVPGLNVLTGTVFVFGLVLLINATNLLDGLDGLASGTVAMGAVGFIAVSADGPDVLALALAGALAGFLLWNRPPASIFLGDAGSYLLGTALALLLGSMVDNDALGLSRSTVALLFIAAPMADTIVAILRRYRAGQPLVRGDRGHIYDQLLARGVAAPWVTVIFVAAQGALVAIGLAITQLPTDVAWMATAAVIAVVSVAVLATFTNPNAAWADNSPVVDVLGTAVRLEAPHEHQAHLRQLVDGLITGRPATRVLALVRDGAAPGTLRLEEDGELVLDGITPDVAEATVVWRLNEVAGEAKGHHVIHAGCVARGNRAVVLPGRSGAGKSELCAAAIGAGYAYLSDEQAALDLRTGLLSPYAKPLGLGHRVVPPTELGPRRPVAPTPPAAIVFPTFDRHARQPTTTALPPALALLGLCAHSSQVDRTSFLWLAGMARACPASAVTYGSSAEGLTAIRKALASADPHPHVRRARPTRSGPEVPGLTAVAMDDDIVVLREPAATVHHLNRSAAFVWRLGAAATGDELVEACLATAPEGALERDEVVATVEWLTTSGLLPDDRDPVDAGKRHRPAAAEGGGDGPVVEP